MPESEEIQPAEPESTPAETEIQPSVIPEVTVDPPDRLEDEPILWILLSNHRGEKSGGMNRAFGKIWTLLPERMFKRFDPAGNLWVDNRHGESKTLFCAHVDTVASPALQGGFKLEITSKGIIRSVRHQKIMGADDGAGVAMLLSLLLADIPGMYLFSHGEESGGLPMRQSLNDAFAKEPFDRCISFDRRGTTDIVADQALGILASETFVSTLSAKLGMGHKWAIGSYTDGSEFKGRIKEIVNISIGYESNHSAWETLDYGYFKELRKAALILDWEALPCIGPDPTKTKWGRSWKYNGDDSYYAYGKNDNVGTNGKKHNGKGFWECKNLETGIYDENGYLIYGDGYSPENRSNLRLSDGKTQRLIPLADMGEPTGIVKKQPGDIDPKDEYTAEVSPNPDVPEQEIWDLEADMLTDALGFDPDVDYKKRDMIGEILKEMYAMGKRAGRKEAFTFMQAIMPKSRDTRGTVCLEPHM
jgi:hypothetical protein